MVAYYGVGENGGKLEKPVAIYPGHHPANIDKDTFERCQRIRRALGKAARKRETGGGNPGCICYRACCGVDSVAG